MASFTDSIPQFNQYVQQLPIDAMVSVGTYKQQKYDEGIQKIQAQIDSVAGMDIIRDVDKQYLHSKMNELNSNLRKVATGDFSNYQLVNSVGGMITQIGKDPNILNAVSSTMKYKKGVEEMNSAIKEGKSSPSNEYFFNRKAQEWLSNPDVKSSFDGYYKPYTNWKKNGLEVLKSLTKDETITEDAFTTDSKGNIVIADANVKKKLAGISPDKIQQALMVGLTPADFQQMEMDGIYTYSNVDSRSFIEGINNSHAQTTSFYNDQKRVLENAKSSTTSVVEKSKLDDQIAAINKTLMGVQSEYEDIVNAANSGNLDAAKARLFTRNSIDGFSRAFSFTEISETYENNPLAEAQRWRQEQEMEWKKFMLTYGQRERELSLKQKEVKLKENEAKGYGGLPVAVNQENVPQYTVANIVEEINSKKQTIELLDRTFLEQQGKDQIWLNQQQEAWEKSPSSVSPMIRQHFSLTENLRRSSLSDSIMLTDIEKQAKEKFGDVYKNIPSDARPIQYGNITITPRDFVDFNSKFDSLVKITPGRFEDTVEIDEEKAKRELTPAQKVLFDIKTGKIPAGDIEKELLNISQYYQKNVNAPFRQTLGDISDFSNEELKKRLAYNQGVAYGVPTSNAAEKSTISTVLTQFADLADSQGGALANSKDFDSELARKLATEDAKYSLTVAEGTDRIPSMYEMSVSGKSGSIKFNITPEQKRAIFGQDFESSPKLKAAQPYLEQMTKMGGFSTAYTKGPSTLENAYLSKIDFPSVNLYGVKGNIVTLMPGSNAYTIKLSLYDPVKKVWHNDIDFPKNGMINAESITDALHMLNDAAIYELINEKPATANDIKTVEVASKKPF